MKPRMVSTAASLIAMAIAAFLMSDSAGAASPPSNSIRTLKTIYAFKRPPSYPSSLLLGGDGNFYGACSGARFGLLYRVTPAGAFSVLHDFAVEGVGSATALTLGHDGNLYGIMSGSGAIFKCTLSGTFSILRTLGAPASPASIVQGSDGNLYGTLRSFGDANQGSIFRLTAAGDFAIIYSFPAVDGARPLEIIEGSPGIFYGTASSPTSRLIFRVTSAGTFDVVHDFGSTGAFPSHLVYASDGNIYGSGDESLFRLTPGGDQITLVDLDRPISSLIQGPDGKLYCATGNSQWQSAVSSITLEGVVTTLHVFAGETTFVGETPEALVFGADHALYGVTINGAPGGEGAAVFRWVAPGQFTTVVRFGFLGPGYSPNKALLQTSDGSFYGATQLGGADGYGTLYRLNPSGNLQTLHEFSGNPGAYPSLIALAADGRLYGGSAGLSQTGAVYRIEANGAFQLLHEFTGGADGSRPLALVAASDGNTYGFSNGGSGFGSFFRITPEGMFTVLREFHVSDEVFSPVGLVEAGNGTLYGASDGGVGAIFQISPQGVTTTLHTFPQPIGAKPSSIVAGRDGNIYGTTPGAWGYYHGQVIVSSPGTVFQCTPAGEFRDLHSFTPPNGIYSPTELMQSNSGDLFGLASGRIYRLTLGGEFTPLYSMAEYTPTNRLIQGNDGKIYGTNKFGGLGGGALFQVVFGQPSAVNLSSRVNIGTGDNVSIGGFVVTGNGPKKVIVRAIGPSLANLGVSGILEDPTLELHDSSGAIIGRNNVWRETQIGGVIGGDQAAEIQASGIAPTADRDSALIATLQPGNYTAVVSGNQGGTGIGLVEIYDLAVEASAQVGNISTRGLVATGNNVMIGGVIVDGSAYTQAHVVFRAIGPSLSQFGVSNSLQDPSLVVYDANGNPYAANDNWRDGQQPEIIALGLAPRDDRESAIYVSLPGGNYTAVVSGHGGTSGVALVEGYNVQ